MWWVKEILNTQHLSDFHIFNNLKLLPPPVKEDVCVSFTQRESAWAALRERKSFRERRDRHQTVPPKFLMPDCWHGTFLLTVRTGSKEVFLFFFIFTDRKSELLISLSALLLFVPPTSVFLYYLFLLLPPSLSCKALDLFCHQLYIKENHHHQLHTRLAGSGESSSETKGPYVPAATKLSCHH